MQQITIYTKNGCSNCLHAKGLLNARHITYEEQVLGIDFTKEYLLEMFPYAKTFPVIIVDGMNIGGYNELKNLVEEQFSDNRKFLKEGNSL